MIPISAKSLIGLMVLGFLIARDLMQRFHLGPARLSKRLSK